MMFEFRSMIWESSHVGLLALLLATAACVQSDTGKASVSAGDQILGGSVQIGDGVARVPSGEGAKFERRNPASAASDVADEATFSAMLDYAPLQRISTRRAPAVLVRTGDQDRVIQPFHSYKFVAALQKATQSNRAFLRIDWSESHGSLRAVERRVADWAADLVFLSSVVGNNNRAGNVGPGQGREVAHSEVTIRHLANEGVLLRAEGRSVLIDALFGDGLPSYETVPPDQRHRLETGADEKLRVDYVLATHGHRDHFDARAVSRYLAAVESARYAGPRATVDSLLRVNPALRDRVVVAGERGLPAWIRPLVLPHGPTSVPVENVGWLVDLGGTSVLHTGDAELSETQWRATAPDRPIDVALLPFWYFMNDGPRSVVIDLVRPREILLFHRPLPGSESAGLRQRGGWDAFIGSVRRDFPLLHVLSSGGEEIRISTGPSRDAPAGSRQ